MRKCVWTVSNYVHCMMSFDTKEELENSSAECHKVQ